MTRWSRAEVWRRWIPVAMACVLILGAIADLAMSRASTPVPDVVAAGTPATGYHSHGRSGQVADRVLTPPIPTGAGDVRKPCRGLLPRPAHYQHIVWIWMENKPYDSVIGAPDSPYVTALARACGLATDYHAIRHPSTPNYLAATSGATHVLHDYNPRRAVPYRQSLFGEAAAAGLTWRDFQESMTAACDWHSRARIYTLVLNPALYYSVPPTTCHADDLPFAPDFARDIDGGTLPAFAFVVPNMCDDTHYCPVRTGDAWLRTWVTRLFEGPDYRSGDTLVVITWDEGIGKDQTIPLIVAAPQLRPGTVVTTRFDHYGLLRMTEDLLGVPPLGAAAREPGLAAAFGL